ncbi:GerAB/ArcD/ProY family transporter [Bacillus sp. REN10]|uniref:GerAB/ArcD/ProY family transporter n=1 Tax=Bacillus sp. REN10 TaxID=2782541 RepID=UPI00193BD4C3|nr:GerAB/ArcD/ProY family transporter [Bacillus sp. REN10]
MLPLPAEKHKVSPYFAFYIISSVQIGVGVLGFQRNVTKAAGHDAWISVVLVGLSMHIIMWMTYQILKKGNNDITVIHRELFGKWIGGLLSLTLMVYLLSIGLTIARNYIEVIQIWIFPQLETWYMAIILFTLVYLYVTSGFRVNVGLCFLTFVITLPLLLMYWFPLQEAKISYLLPILDHSLPDIISGSKEVSFSYSGFETIFFCYPFIKQAERSHKWAQLGVAYTTFIYLLTIIVSLLYFSHWQLSNTIWATLTLWKVINLPFVERFEYAGLTLWLLVILPNICLYTWAATRGIKQLFNIKQKHSVILLIVALFITVVSITELKVINKWLTSVGYFGLFVFYVYIPFVYFFQIIRNKMRRPQ